MYQKQFDRFEQKVWLSSPTMHGEELGVYQRSL